MQVSLGFLLLLLFVYFLIQYNNLCLLVRTVCLFTFNGFWGMAGSSWHFVVCFLPVYWFFVPPFLTSLGDRIYLYYFIFISLRDLTYSSWCVFSYCSRNYFV